MIIRITNKCRMGCKHCMVYGTGPAGDHMKDETFEQAVAFAEVLKTPVLLSGGEPTEHPKLFEYIDFIKQKKCTAILLSNGMFDEDVERRLIDRRIFVQITNDPRFYPVKVRGHHHSHWTFEQKVDLIFPCRRTRENGIEVNRLYPACVNLRYATRNHGFFSAVRKLSLIGRVCSPSVNIDGTIRAGEADTCFQLGTVWDAPEHIEKAIKNMDCNVCGLRKNLKRDILRLFDSQYCV